MFLEFQTLFFHSNDLKVFLHSCKQSNDNAKAMQWKNIYKPISLIVVSIELFVIINVNNLNTEQIYQRR